MKNLVDFSYELVNGKLCCDKQLMERSLVLFNGKGKGYNIIAKVRNTDKFSVVRALAKAVLIEKRLNLQENNEECVKRSKNTEACKINSVLGCSAIAVTDKKGNIISSSWLLVERHKQGGKLRNIMKFSKAMPIYKLVVEQGLDWSDKRVVEELDAWVEAAIKHLDYETRLDEALDNAATSTEAEEKAAEKAAKEAAKKSEAKEEIQAAA